MTDLQEIIDNFRAANTEALVNVVATEHRTNQQLMAKNIFAIVKHWSNAYENNNYDLRNEETCLRANKMMEAIKNHIDLPYI